MTIWRAGMPAVCINDNFGDLAPGEHTMKRGRTYTVRSVVSTSTRTGLRFVEVVNPIVHCGPISGECFYDAAHFRPAVEKPTSIEIFQRMLRPAEQRERV